MTPMELTEEQQQVVQLEQQHAKVIAVAGSGKTATLTHFIQAKLQQQANANRMLVLMYNSAVQQAFSQRLSQLLEPHQSQPEIRTFHSLGYKLYHRLIAQGQLAPISEKLLSKSEIELQLKLLLEKHAPKALLPTIKEQSQDWIDAAYTALTFFKSNLNSAAETIKSLKYPKEQLFIADIIEHYETWRISKGRISFDDMIYDPVKLLHGNPDITKQFANKVDWILVDEYQDINAVQHYLLGALAGDRAQVISIGDPDQTIYEFRGSQPHFILKTFQKDFHPCRTQTLSQTFRFGHELALAANNLIQNNRNRHPVLTVSNQASPATQIKIAQTDNHGEKIADTIAFLRSKQIAPDSIAVLSRLWAFIRPIELHLLANQVPYSIEGGQSIFDCPEIQPCLTLLQLQAGIFSELTQREQQSRLFQLITTPSPKVSHSIIREVAQLWQQKLKPTRVHQSLSSALGSLKNPYQKKQLNFVAKAIQLALKTKKASVCLSTYAQQRDMQSKLEDNALNKTQGQEQAGTINAFIQYIHTLQEQHPVKVLDHLEALQQRTKQTGTEAQVVLSTIHRAKGLEWPYVFIPNLIESHLPYLDRSTQQSLADIESERRLMYVGMTRAIKGLFLTIPKQTDDKTNLGQQTSRFIKEMRLDECKQVRQAIDEQCSQIALPEKPSHTSAQYAKLLLGKVEFLFPHAQDKTTGNQNWQLHQWIKHQQFGPGKITALDNKKMEIEFLSGQTRAFSPDKAGAFLELA